MTAPMKNWIHPTSALKWSKRFFVWRFAVFNCSPIFLKFLSSCSMCFFSSSILYRRLLFRHGLRPRVYPMRQRPRSCEGENRLEQVLEAHGIKTAIREFRNNGGNSGQSRRTRSHARDVLRRYPGYLLGVFYEPGAYEHADASHHQ